MPKLKILNRSPKGKSIFLVFSRYEGWSFINRKEVFYYANIYSKKKLPEDDEIKKIVSQMRKQVFTPDKRLSKTYTHKVDLKEYPEISIQLKKTNSSPTPPEDDGKEKKEEINKEAIDNIKNSVDNEND